MPSLAFDPNIKYTLGMKVNQIKILTFCLGFGTALHAPAGIDDNLPATEVSRPQVMLEEYNFTTRVGKIIINGEAVDIFEKDSALCLSIFSNGIDTTYKFAFQRDLKKKLQNFLKYNPKLQQDRHDMTKLKEKRTKLFNRTERFLVRLLNSPVVNGTYGRSDWKAKYGIIDRYRTNNFKSMPCTHWDFFTSLRAPKSPD